MLRVWKDQFLNAWGWYEPNQMQSLIVESYL